LKRNKPTEVSSFSTLASLYSPTLDSLHIISKHLVFSFVSSSTHLRSEFSIEDASLK